MKLKCTVSHRITTEGGGYKDYTAGEIYDLPDEYEAWPYFEPVDSASSPQVEKVKQKKRGGEEQ